MAEDVYKTLEEIIEAEKHMHARFKKLATEAETPEMRALFEELAKEEEGHEKVLTERLIALRFMKEK